jgi:hypothetical protein
VLLVFVSRRSSAFLPAIHLIDFVTQLTAVLHAGSLVSCHNFLSLRLYFRLTTALKCPIYNPTARTAQKTSFLIVVAQ